MGVPIPRVETSDLNGADEKGIAMEMVKAAARAIAWRIALVVAAAGVCAHPAAAQPQETPSVLEYGGTVVAARETEIAPRFDGLLAKIHFAPGQFVNEGDLLFEFEPAEKELLLDVDRARRQRAETLLRLNELNLRNKQTLREKDVASQQQLLIAEGDRDVAAADAAEARTKERMAELTLREMKLYAPNTGIIGRPLVREGAYLTKTARDQSSMVVITQLDPIQVVGRVPFDVYLQRREILKTDEQAVERLEFELILPNGDRFAHVGHLVSGGFEFDRTTQTIAIAVEFPNPMYLLRPGLVVTLRSSVRANEPG